MLEIEYQRRLPAQGYVMYPRNSCKPIMQRDRLLCIIAVRTVMYRVYRSAEEPVAYRVDASITRTLLVATPGMEISVDTYLNVIMEDSMITRVPELITLITTKQSLAGAEVVPGACGARSANKNKQTEKGDL